MHYLQMLHDLSITCYLEGDEEKAQYLTDKGVKFSYPLMPKNYTKAEKVEQNYLR